MSELDQRSPEVQLNQAVPQSFSSQQFWGQDTSSFARMPFMPVRSSAENLPHFEVVANPSLNNSPEHQMMVHQFSLELLTGRMTDDVRQYLSSQMNAGPDALNQASREINEDMIRTVKGYPESSQLRLSYNVTRNQQTDERIYSVNLIQHRHSRVLDGITFRVRS